MLITTPKNAAATPLQRCRSVVEAFFKLLKRCKSVVEALSKRCRSVLEAL